LVAGASSRAKPDPTQRQMSEPTDTSTTAAGEDQVMAETIMPCQTLYLNNLNEKIKIVGKMSKLFAPCSVSHTLASHIAYYDYCRCFYLLSIVLCITSVEGVISIGCWRVCVSRCLARHIALLSARATFMCGSLRPVGA
jgi:hypothetical protein